MSTFYTATELKAAMLSVIDRQVSGKEPKELFILGNLDDEVMDQVRAFVNSFQIEPESTS